MKDYTVDDPKFSKKITITEITDTNHADNINKAPKQVFENTLFLEKSKVSANGGDVSDTIIQSAAAVEDEYPIPVAGDTPKTLLGKTKKFFESIKNWMTGVCLLGHIVNNCVTDRSDLPLSAAQGKALMDAVNVLNTKKAERLDLVRISSSQPQYVECLNCLVLIISANASCFDLYSCIGYQSDNVRSVITHIAGKGRSKIEYAAEGSTFCGQGKYKVINENSINEAVVYRIRLT